MIDDFMYVLENYPNANLHSEAARRMIATSLVNYMCVAGLCISHMSLEEMIPSLRKKESTGRPPGWHFMNEFVDKKGNVFHKGKEQPELKGTLKPTKVKPRKKKKKLTADEKLYKELNKWKKRKKAMKKNK